jgi:hypothetical protein
MVSYSSTVFTTKFHWREPSIKERVSLNVVDVQTRFISLAFESLEDKIHAPVIAEHVIHCQIQGMQRHLKHSFLSEFGLTSALFPGDL